MNSCLEALKRRFAAEPYARAFGITVIDLEEGRALLQMKTDESMNNIFDCTHGAAIYSLMDAAFELAVNSHGTVAVALGGGGRHRGLGFGGRGLLDRRRGPGDRAVLDHGEAAQGVVVHVDVDQAILASFRVFAQ
ncbi:MAG: DUF4442 domain-containing protein, partial [Methanothrix sp.]|nr:DUF4442 domain-containing protein [Methanothrix sp.]